jgi:hypothetical protein
MVTCLIALLAWPAVAQPPTPAPAPEPMAPQRTLELRDLQIATRQLPIPGGQILRGQDAILDLVEYDAVQTTDGGQMVVSCSVGPVVSPLGRRLSLTFHTTPFLGEKSTTRLTFRVDNAELLRQRPGCCDEHEEQPVSGHRLAQVHRGLLVRDC